jgi:hypothetical protein
VAYRDPRSPHHQRVERPDRRSEPVRQEGEALRARLPQLRELPAPRPAPHRRRHLAGPPITTTHPAPALSAFPTETRRAMNESCGCAAWARDDVRGWPYAVRDAHRAGDLGARRLLEPGRSKRCSDGIAWPRRTSSRGLARRIRPDCDERRRRPTRRESGPSCRTAMTGNGIRSSHANQAHSIRPFACGTAPELGRSRR